MEDCKCIKSEELQYLRDKVNDHDKRITKIESNRELQEYQHTQVMDILNELKKDVKEMKETPGKRWDLILIATITSIIGAATAIIVPKMFK